MNSTLKSIVVWGLFGGLLGAIFGVLLADNVFGVLESIALSLIVGLLIGAYVLAMGALGRLLRDKLLGMFPSNVSRRRFFKWTVLVAFLTGTAFALIMGIATGQYLLGLVTAIVLNAWLLLVGAVFFLRLLRLPTS
jgi:hypothetical protein